MSEPEISSEPVTFTVNQGEKILGTFRLSPAAAEHLLIDEGNLTIDIGGYDERIPGFCQLWIKLVD